MNKLFKIIVIACLTLGVIMAVWNLVIWPNSIYNPVNDPYIEEVAFNKEIPAYRVTQKMFRERYLKEHK